MMPRWICCWPRCHDQSPDVTADEVSQLFEVKWLSLCRNRAITNLPRGLIDAVSKSCTRAALRCCCQGGEDPAPDLSGGYTREQLEEMLRSGTPSQREIAEAELSKENR